MSDRSRRYEEDVSDEEDRGYEGDDGDEEGEDYGDEGVYSGNEEAPHYQETAGGESAPHHQERSGEEEVSSEEEDRGYDDPYGFKSKERVESGDPDFYANEKIYHDTDYRDDRYRQRAEYYAQEVARPYYTTEAIRERASSMYPESNADPGAHRYYEGERTCQYTSDREAQVGGPERENTTRGNREAQAVLRDENVARTDFAYPETDRLRNRYCQAVYPNREEDILNADAIRRREQARYAQDDADNYDGGGEE